MAKFKGNKGEWSELYVFLKLLFDRRLYGADSNINVLSEIYYDILSIFRYESEGKYSYSPNKEKNKVIIKLEGHDSIQEVPLQDFLKHAKKILIEIKKHKRGSIEIPEVEDFAKFIQLKELAQPSTKKADIYIKTYDFRTGFTPELAFSIKSQLGSPATLLNASKATNFRYIVKNITDEEIVEKFNKEKKFDQKFKLLRANSIELEFDKILNKTFHNNLILIDSDLPKIISEYLKESFYSNEKKIEMLTPIVSDKNPLKISHNDLSLFYSYKWKEFLTNIALGISPNSQWDGKYEATGGYIIVKEQGEIVCYHIYNRNEFRDYLYKNIKFENGSTSRHKFGKIYNDGERYFLNLNLQLRFLK